jgi:ferrochelatase
MRCWHPFTDEAIAAVKAFAPEEIVLLPLYPQYSTTTTQSSLTEWRRQSNRKGVSAPQHEVCCYPTETGFISALADLLGGALDKRTRLFPIAFCSPRMGCPNAWSTAAIHINGRLSERWRRCLRA